MNSKISIIIPAYDAEDTIEDCVKSILGQSCKDIEVIIVNDGSQDSTEILIKRLAEDHGNIKYIYQSNGGVSKARNVGLNHAEGEYVYFVDADDVLKEDTIEKLAKLLKKSDFDLIASEIIDRYGTSKTKDIYIQKSDFIALDRKTIAENIFYIRMGSAVGKLYKKELIDRKELRFQENIGLAEDFIFVHKYVECCSSVAKSGASHYLVRNRPISLSKMYCSNIEAVIKKQNEVLENMFVRFPEYREVYNLYEMNHIASGCVMYVKNLYLMGNPYTRRERLEKIRKMYSFGYCKIFHELRGNEGPKLLIDQIYCVVFKLDSIYLADLFFLLRERIRKIKTQIQFQRRDS